MAEAVAEAVARACSQDPAVFRPASQQLSLWETQPGFYSALQAIVMNYSVDNTVRMMAALCFKNGIDRYWRRGAANEISLEEKDNIRAQLATAVLSEQCPQVQAQLDLVVSKIARHDIPGAWPALLPHLVQAVRTSEGEPQARAIVVTYRVVKELSSKRLAPARRLFYELTSDLFPLLLDLWTRQVATLFNAAQATNNMETLGQYAKLAHLTLKILRQLFDHGFESFHTVEIACLFLSQVIQRCKEYESLRISLPENDDEPLSVFVDKSLITLGKVLLESQDLHPLSFARFLQPSMAYALGELLTPTGMNRRPLERQQTACMVLVRSVVLCPQYKPLVAKVASNISAAAAATNAAMAEEQGEAHRIYISIFDNATLTNLVQAIVTRLLLLSEEDLIAWNETPEDFAFDDAGEAWKYQLRPSAEHLLRSLVHEFQATLAPYLLSLAQEAIGYSNSELRAALYKDAVFTSLGLSAYDLFELIDFPNWFATYLVPEMQRHDHANDRIIRRRIAWLLGCWSAVKLPPATRPALYSRLMRLLDPAEDLVVRLTAATTLKTSMDDFDFRSEDFLPVLPEAMAQLVTLLCQVQECDTKMQVLSAISTLIDRVGLHIREHSGSITDYLPKLWVESESHNLLRGAILSTLVRLVEALGPYSVRLYGFVIPVIQFGADIRRPEHLYLLEDSLNLWACMLQWAPQPTPDLISLFQLLLPLMTRLDETLKTCLCIVESYMYLCPAEALQLYGPPLVQTCSEMLSELSMKAVVMLCKIIETVLVALPDTASGLFAPVCSRVLESVVLKDPIAIITVAHLGVLLRWMLCAEQMLPTVAAGLTSQHGADMLGRFWDCLLDKFDSFGEPQARKLYALAVSAALSSPAHQPYIAQRIELVCGVLISSLSEFHTGPDGVMSSEDSMVRRCPSPLAEDDECNPEYIRKQQCMSKDAIYSLTLRDVAAAGLNRFLAAFSEADRATLLARCVHEELEQLGAYLNMRLC